MPSYLNFILLFILSFHFTQQHQIFPTSTFPLHYFPILFILLIAYLVTIIKLEGNKNTKFLQKAQLIIFTLIVLITVGRTTYSAIWLRHQVGESYPVHDNPPQIEEAAKFLLSGKNPYTEDYDNSQLGRWHQWDTNPAIKHVITLPFYLLFSTLVSIPAEQILSFFDQRMVHVVSLLIVIYIIHKLNPQTNKKIFYLTLFIFNPLFIHFFIEGRNDIFVFSLVFLSLWFLHYKKLFWSSLVMGLAFASKQSSWLIFPFYFFYIMRHFGQERKRFRSGIFNLVKICTATITKALCLTWPFWLTIMALFIPFIISDAKSFIEDIYYYPAGGLPTSYPIKGLGFSEILAQKNIIPRTENYPFFILQLVFAIPVAIVSLWLMVKKSTISFLLFSYGVFLFVFWYFSRFFNDNYLGYLTMVFLAGIMFKETKSVKSKARQR